MQMFDIGSPSRTEVSSIFNNRITVRIIDEISRSISLRLIIRQQSDANSLLFSHSSSLCIQLIDDDDPYIHYTTSITDDQYERIKSQQNLLADFHSFPQRLIDLIKSCINDQSKPEPRYRAELYLDRANNCAQLELCEINPFKKLTHLSIRLSSADEAFVKKNIVQTLLKLKSERDRCQSALQSMESKCEEKLQSYKAAAEKYQQEVEKMKADYEHQLQVMRGRQMQEMQVDKDRLQMELSERLERITLEKTDMEDALKQRIRNLESSVDSLGDTKMKLEAKLQDLQICLSQTQAKLVQSQEATRIATERADLLQREKERSPNAKDNQELRIRTAELKAELEALKVEHCKASIEKRKLEEALEQKSGQIQRREIAVKELSEDVNKAKQIIQNLDAEKRALLSKVKVRSDVVVKQEEVIQMKDREIRKLNERISQRNDDTASVNKLRAELADKEQKIISLQKQLEHNKGVIDWLNKKMNDLKGHKVDTPLLKGHVMSPLGDASNVPRNQNDPFPGQNLPVAHR